MALIASVPVLRTPSGRRFEVVAWVVALYPVMIPVYLYATWLTAWWALGHPPRSIVDDPKYLGPLVDVSFRMTVFSFMMAMVYPVAAFAITFGPFPTRSEVLPVYTFGLIPLVWLVVFVAIMTDPLGVLDWFID